MKEDTAQAVERATIKVLVADAQLTFCDALAIALGNDPGLSVLNERPHTAAATIEAASLRRPDVILLDYWLDIEGPTVTRAIMQRVPTAKVIVTSWFHGAENIRGSLRAGAAGFLPKGIPVKDVRAALHRAHAGEALPFGAELAALMDRIEEKDRAGEVFARRLATLTPRELEVLRDLSCGLRPEQIAKRTGTKTGTVRNHINSILDKMKASSQLEAVVMAKDGGLL